MQTQMQTNYHVHPGCRLCSSKKLDVLLKLKPTPPANQFTPTTEVDQPKIPLDLMKCDACNHVQLAQVVAPESLFEDYVYVSGTSQVFCKHFEDYADSIIRRQSLTNNDLVIDIGSNDGTLLKYFQQKGIKILGVDPAKKISEQANERGIRTINGYFSREMAQEIGKKWGLAKVITANNAFAHIDDIASVVEGIRYLLDKEGIFVFEVSYLLDVINKKLFDTIYHEHLDYHSVLPLTKFFASYGMRFFHAEKVETHGGSLRGFVCHADAKIETDPSVENFIAFEEKEKIFDKQTYLKFSDEISLIGKQLREKLSEAKSEGAIIAGFGAPAKATTLMHHLEIGKDLIDYIVDDSHWKQGLFTPGLHIPVVDSKRLYQDLPKYIVVLAWNFAEPIMKKHEELKTQGCKFIVPLPELKIY